MDRAQCGSLATELFRAQSYPHTCERTGFPLRSVSTVQTGRHSCLRAPGLPHARADTRGSPGGHSSSAYSRHRRRPPRLRRAARRRASTLRSRAARAPHRAHGHMDMRSPIDGQKHAACNAALHRRLSSTHKAPGFSIVARGQAPNPCESVHMCESNRKLRPAEMAGGICVVMRPSG